MKIQEKAKLYDQLLNDYKLLIDDIRKFKKDLEDIPENEDIKSLKDSNYSLYNASLIGLYSSMPMALDIKIWKHENNLKHYQNLK